FMDANGACPAPVAPIPPPQPAGAPNAAAPAMPPEPTSLLGAAIGLGMSECDVVNRAGAATSVNLGRNPRGERTATLTYQSGPRPGLYHFESGHRVDIERVEEPAPPPAPAKKKPAKPRTAKNDNT